MLGLSRAYRSLILSVLVVAGGSVACAGPVDSTPRSTRIRIADIPLVTQVPFYVALDSAYFRDEGIDVELVAVRATSDAVTLVATNQVDVGGFGPDPAVFNAMQRGVGIKMLASAAVFSAGTRASGLVVRQVLIDTGDYRRLADLKGRKIAVSAAQSEFYVERTLARDGVAPTDVKFTTLANADMVPALANGAVDAAWEVEPLVGAIQTQHTGTLVATGLDALPGGVPWILFESSNFAQANLGIRSAFVRAYMRGLRDFYHAFNQRDGPRDVVLASLAAHSAIHDEAVLNTVGMHTVDPNGSLNLAALDQYQEYYLRTGDQTRRVDLGGALDPEPLELALSDLGRM